jgi:hypothetical protein
MLYIVVPLFGTVVICFLITAPIRERASANQNLKKPSGKLASPSSQEVAKEWEDEARFACLKDALPRSRAVMNNTGLDFEWSWLSGDVRMSDLDDQYGYFLFRREYKATIFGTKLKKTMWISYRCWGEKVKCEYTNHGTG